MSVTRFRQRTPGPECEIEDAIENHIKDLCFPHDPLLWMGGSIPVGAGRPDLVVASCDPNVLALAHVDMPTVEVLAYLRAVNEARPETIVNRIGATQEVVIRYLDGLVEAQAVSAHATTYSLAPCWREILPEVVTIEAKVSDWQRAVEQAARNRIFAHRSFVGLPDTVAKRVRREPVFAQLGLGIFGVNNKHEVRIVRRGDRRQPRVWWYYYQVALMIAQHFGRPENAICRTVASSPGRLS